MTKDLKMTGNDYNIALFIFFPSYIVFEVPSNILIKRLAPSTLLSGLMFCWGIITIAQGLVKTKESLYAMRFLLGFFESGFFPGKQPMAVRLALLSNLLTNLALVRIKAAHI